MADPDVSASYRWADTPWGELSLGVEGYLTEYSPPRRLTTSVRTILVDSGRVLVCATPDGPHVWPGGRRRPHESPEQTLVREVHEETGWTIEVVRRLGFLLLRHQQPRPEGYPYPYPHFYWLVYLSHPRGHATGGPWEDLEGWEHASSFVDADSVPDLDAVQRRFLAAALASSAEG